MPNVSAKKGASLKVDTAHKKDAVPTHEKTASFDFAIWIKNHKQAFRRALFHLSHNRFATLITILVIATTLTLPAMFQIASNNLQGKDDKLAQHSGISVFLKSGTSTENIQRLITTLGQKPEVESVRFIPAEQALLEFQQSLGISSEALLQSSPIPPVLYVTPKIDNYSTADIEKLKSHIAASSDVDIIQVDIEWIGKLYAVTDLIRNAAILLALFLIFTILVVIGNTVRLLAQHYHDEIMISKLMGATDAYVRRPFLYSGLLFGLAGGLMACLFVFSGFLWLYPEINNLIMAYNSQISISGLSLTDILSLLSIGSLLGIGGAWVASNRIINEISL